MKKVFIAILSILLLSSNTYAIDNTSIEKVVYKWYKEEQVNGIYYPKSKNLPGYYEDLENITYDTYSEWNSQFCDYSKTYYDIEEKTINTYKKIIKTRYVLFSLFYMQGTNDEFKVIKVFHNNKEVNYTIVENQQAWLILELDHEYDSEGFSFYIEMYHPYAYVLTLANDKYANKPTLINTIVSRESCNNIVVTDDWIYSNTTYIVEEEDEDIQENNYTIKLSTNKICRVREINTYRYKINKKYYDDDYHVYVEGYIPDTQNMSIYYKDNNTKQKEEKIEKSPISSPSKNNNIPTKQQTQIVTKYINKIIKSIPTKIYIILFAFLVIITLQSITILKKCRLKHL